MTFSLASLDEKRRRAKYKVAVICPTPFGNYGEVLRAIKLYNEKSPEIFFVHTFYSYGLSANNTKVNVEKVHANKYDVVIAIGNMSSVITAEKLNELKSSIPLIYIGAGTQGITQKIYPNSVSIDIPYFNSQKAASFFTRIKPTLKSVVFCYDDYTNYNKEQKVARFWSNVIKDTLLAFSKLNVNVNEYVIIADKHINHVEALQKAIESSDGIFLSEGGATPQNLYGAIKHLCNKLHKPLFTCNLKAVKEHSALGYGTTFTPLGKKATEYVGRILFGEEKVNNLPYYELTTARRFAINKSLLSVQGLNESHVLSVINEMDEDVIIYE